MKLLDTGIVKYRTRLWRQKIQLFNPLFYLFQVTAYIALLPVNMLHKADNDVMANDQAPLVSFVAVSENSAATKTP